MTCPNCGYRALDTRGACRRCGAPMRGAPHKTLGDEEAAPRVANAPVSDAPLADTPLADAPLADTPLADAPVAEAPVADTPVPDTPVADAPPAGAAQAVDPQPAPDVLDLVESHIIEPVEPPRAPQGADPAAEAPRAWGQRAGNHDPRRRRADPGPLAPGGSAPPLDAQESEGQAAGRAVEPPAALEPPVGRAVEPRALPKPPVGRVYAGFWERLIAATVDATLLLLVFLLMAAGALLVVGGPGALVDPAAAAAQLEDLSGLFTAFEFLVAAIYHVFFVAAAGATPGKAALGLEVVRTDGAPVAAGRAFVRFAGYALELIPGMILASTVWIMGLSISVLLAQPLLGLTFGAAGAVLLGLGYLWIAFDPRKQAWHDKLAGTVVVKP